MTQLWVELGKVLLQCLVVSPEDVAGLGKWVFAADASAHAAEQSFQVLDLCVASEPVSRDHPSRDISQCWWENVMTHLKRGVGLGRELREGACVVLRPVAGQEVVVIDVDKDSAPVPEFWREHVTASSKHRVGVSEGVDFPVLFDASAHVRIDGLQVYTADEVAGKASGHRSVTFTAWVQVSQVDVGEVIQRALLGAVVTGPQNTIGHSTTLLRWKGPVKEPPKRAWM